MQYNYHNFGPVFFNHVLPKVWRLSDVDGDGMLDSDEFALAMHLINVKLEGYDLPDELPGRYPNTDPFESVSLDFMRGNLKS